MKNKLEIIDQQNEFISEMKNIASRYVESLDKSQIETVLLSGSVARGDYFPSKKEDGSWCGNIDLIVMKKSGCSKSAEEVFGKDIEPEIPFHCVNFNDVEFQIDFVDFISSEKFSKFDEAKKFSVLESEILYDADRKYENELKKINEAKHLEVKKELENKLGYIYYLLSDYKKDRWNRRDAFLQLHENLNTAIRMAVCCLYYVNDSYVPAEDRQLYYSLTLEKLPENYEKVIAQLKSADAESKESYLKRKELFRETLLKFVEGNKN